jgi:YVTN family beta-propeller protein
MRRPLLTGLVIGLCILSTAAFIAPAAAPNNYHLLKKVPLGAAEGGSEYFDYINVDAAARRAYLSHGTEFLAVDVENGNVLGRIGGFKRNHGIALVPELGRGFVSDGYAAEIVIVDLKTFQRIGVLKGEKDADSILYDPASKRVFVFNGDPKSMTVIDPAKQTVISTVALGGTPEQAVADGKGTIYDNLEDTNEVIAIDSQTLKIKSRWPAAPAGQLVSMAMDRQHRRLFIGGRNPRMLVVMNADNGKIIGEGFPIGDRVDTNVFDPETGFIAASTREGTIHIFHEDSPDKISAVETVKTEFGAKTMGLDSKTHNLLVDTADFETPKATAQQANPQPSPKPGTFRLLIYGR